MRSSLVLGVTLLLTIAVTSIVQARTIKSEHTCGSLGPGTNACKCEEIVVKAAKVQKPLVYASPEAINEAALARQAVAKLSVATGSHSNPISGCRPHSSGIISTSSSSSSSSNSRYSTSSSSASSSIGYLGGGSYSSFNPILDDVSSSSGCGCGKKFEPLEARDLLSSNTDKQIVPSDLGYAPVNAVLTNKWSQSTDSINTLDAEDNVEGCAPVGPPTPDYVPGNVLINQEIVKNDGEEDGNYKDENVYVHYYEDGRSFEEDDPEDSTSGIFARLRSSAKKYGLPCGVA